MNTTSRRALLAGAPVAAAAALAGGTITTALAMAPPKKEGLDWPAIVRRAEEVTDRLQKYYGPDWTSGDQEAAAGVLAYCRDRGAGLPDDETAWKATLSFFWDYGQSLDYVMYGDPASMIAKSAARSPRGRPAWEADVDPIRDVIAEHRAADVGVVAAYAREDRVGDDDEITDAAQERAGDALYDLFTTAPTTVDGAAALLEYLGTDATAWNRHKTIWQWANDGTGEEVREFPGFLADALRDIVGRGQA
jgi:hypothetical protein